MQPRSLIIALVLGAATAVAAAPVSAQQIYTWKDASGVTHFSQTPPAAGTRYTRMKLQGSPEISSNPAPTPDTQNALPQPATPPANSGVARTQPDTANNRANLCKQLASNISVLQSKQPVVTGSGANQAVMSDNARDRTLATARAQQSQYCSTPST